MDSGQVVMLIYEQRERDANLHLIDIHEYTRILTIESQVLRGVHESGVRFQ